MDDLRKDSLVALNNNENVSVDQTVSCFFNYSALVGVYFY